MNFEDVDFYDIHSVGQYIMENGDYNLGLTFYNYQESGIEKIDNAMMVCALRIMHYFMASDNESEHSEVNDWYEISQGTGSDNDKETYEAFQDSLEQHEDELHEVEEAIKEYQGGVVVM